MKSRRLPSLPSTALLLAFWALIPSTQSSASDSGDVSPHFTAHPADVIAALGRQATLQCGVSGSPAPSVAWYKEGEGAVVVEGGITVSGSGELRISSVSQSDAGNYYCIASNVIGSIRSLSAALEIAVISSVTEQSGSTSRVLGERGNIILDCYVPDSLPPASVEWTLNSDPLTESHYSVGRMGKTLAGKLVISSFDEVDDIGPYECSVSNGVIGETVQSREYILLNGNTQPLSIPTQIVAPPTSATVVAGDLAQLECFTTGHPVATVSWEKDGSPLTASTRHTFTQAERLLTIGDVEQGDAGVYKCLASSLGNTVEAQATLTVIVPPTIAPLFLVVCVNVTEEVILRCEVEASGNGTDMEWEWRVNGSEVVPSGRLLFDRSGLVSQLQLTSVEEGDQGVYQCVASRGGRQAAASRHLSVIFTPPEFVSQPTSDQLVFKDETVTLPCVATGFPPPTFSWVKSAGVAVVVEDDSRLSIPAQDSGDGSLTISEVRVQDSSSYQCRASNTAGSINSNSVQLRVLDRSVVVMEPADLAAGSSDNVRTISFDATINIPCRVTRSDITPVYEWNRDGEVVADPVPGTSELELSQVTQEDRGTYECVVILTVSGVGGQPLREIIGSVTIGVGAPPTNPTSPTSPSVTSLSSHTLTLHWTPPTSSGNLPLIGYTVEVQLLGNPLCPQVEPEWAEHQFVENSTASQVVVTDLVPYQQYLVRIRARNSAFESEPSQETGVVWTMEHAPSAAPSNVNAVSGVRQITVSWQPPSNCLDHGGVLTDYTVTYKITTESTPLERIVGSSQTSLLLTSLSPSSNYTITVSAHTAEGAGPTSVPIFANTTIGSTPPPPLEVTAAVTDSTTVQLSWTRPVPTDSVDSYIITWYPDDTPEDIEVMIVSGADSSATISNLEPGQTYVFSIRSSNQYGFSETMQLEVTAEAPSPDAAITSQVWFIALVAVVGTLLVFGIPTIILCLVCFRCNRQEGKIYITARRSASSVSGASTGFSEYQQKHRGVSRATRITVHPSPPPQRRNTDYADLGFYQSHTSTTASVGSNYLPDVAPNGGPPGRYRRGDEPQMEPSPLEGDLSQYLPSPPHMNQGVQSYPHNNRMPSTDSNMPDTMVRLPSPPPENFPPQNFNEKHRFSNIYRGSSQESAESWNPADSLNYRGHMTNRDPVSRSSTMRSVSSVDSRVSGSNHVGNVPTLPAAAASNHHRGRPVENVPTKGSALNVHSDWSAVPGSTNQLPPVHEHQVMETSTRDLSWRPRQPGSVPTHNLHHSHHNSQPQVARNSSSPPPPPLPTSLPPLSSSLVPQHTRSMEHILDHPGQTRMEPRQGSLEGRMELGPISRSHAQFQSHNPHSRPGMLMNHGSSQPAIPVAGDWGRAPSPEYAEPEQVIRDHKAKETAAQDQRKQAKKPLAVPPKSKSKRFGGGSKSRHSQKNAPVQPPSQPPPLPPPLQPAAAAIQPKPVPTPKVPPARAERVGSANNEQNHGHQPTRALSLEQDRTQPPTTFPRALSLDQDRTHPPTASHQPRQNDLKDVLTQWKSRQERQERTRARQLERNPRNTNHPLNGLHDPGRFLNMPDGIPSMDSATDSQFSSQLSYESDRWRNTPSPNSQGAFSNHIQNSTTPIVKNAPLPGFPAQHPQNDHRPSRHLGAPKQPRMVARGPRKNMDLELEGIYQRDLRKPRRRKGHVPGAVWKQMPMNTRIESSSESCDSDDTEVGRENTSVLSEYV